MKFPANSARGRTEDSTFHILPEAWDKCRSRWPEPGTVASCTEHACLQCQGDLASRLIDHKHDGHYYMSYCLNS